MDRFIYFSWNVDKFCNTGLKSDLYINMWTSIAHFTFFYILISCWKKTFYEVECFKLKYQVSTLQYTVYATPLSKRISKISFKNHNHKSVKYALMIKSRLKVQCAEIILKEYKSNYNYLLWIMYYT